MIGMLVLLMNLADLKISNLISGSIICQAAERQSENTETENNSGGTEKEKITQTEASTVSDILEELDLSRVQRIYFFTSAYFHFIYMDNTIDKTEYIPQPRFTC